MLRNPPWTRDKLILALDLYFRINPTKTDKSHPEIKALSKLLNRLPIHKSRPDAEKFRNPDGVYMKLGNFLSVDTSYEGKGLRARSKLDKMIWDEFSNDRKRLSAVA